MELTQRYNEDLLNSMRYTVWVTDRKSWYFDDFGKIAMWSMGKFRDEMAAPQLEDFGLRKLAERTQAAA
jgi:hypothetical protein